MRFGQKRGFGRNTRFAGNLSSAVKIGLLLTGIGIGAYFAERGEIPPSPMAAIENADDGIPQAVAAATEQPSTIPGGAPATPIPETTADWTGPGIDPGDYRRSETGPEPTETADSDTSADEQANPEQRVLLVRRGDTLLDLLLNAGISRAEAHEAVSALRGVFNPRDLKPGQEITLTVGTLNVGEHPALLGASFNANPERDINLSRDTDGRFTALRRDKELQRELVRATGTVRSSLFEAGSAAGVPGTIMVDLIRAFSYDVDFQRDVQPGDAFDVMFERYRDEDGRFAKDGDVLYGALTLSGTSKRIYRYTRRDGTTDYYNDKGESVRKALLRTPIDGARLTSGFGVRMHPILGYSAMHKGVDFGAPSGTPIQAAGDGVVEVAGWNGGYGQYIRIRHNAEYATAYAHLSRIASGVRPGEHIRQGQVIGYVGATGRATGPHLHYEVVRRGTQINPVAVQLPTGRKLDGNELAQFRTAKAELDLKVAATEPIHPVSHLATSSGGAEKSGTATR